MKGQFIRGQVWKQGNSLVITIPFRIRDALRLQEGDILIMTLRGEKLTVTKSKPEQGSGEPAPPL